MKLLKIGWMVVAAWIAVSCGGDQFAGLRAAVDDYTANPGSETDAQVRAEARKLSGEALQVSDDELVVTEPILLTLDHTASGAAFFTFSGKAKAKRDIVIQPANDYAQKAFRQGEPVGIRLVFRAESGDVPHELLAYAGTAPLQVGANEIILKADTEIILAGNLSLGRKDLHQIKKAGGRIWLAQSNFVK